MRLKKLGAALFVVAALSAVLASSAFAAATTTDVAWLTGASPGTELTGSKSVTSSQVGTSTFATTVSGQAVELHSTNIECVECKIENSGGTAVGSGKLKFTGVTVAKPAGCTVASTIETKALKVKADYMIGTVDYILFEPSAGSETAFASIALTGSCPITTIIPKGTLFVQAANATGVQASEQEVHSSAAINSTAGGSLHVGTETASLTDSVKFSIGGTAFGTSSGGGGGGETEKLPNGTTVTGFSTITEEGKEVPVINWSIATPIDTKGCKGGKVTVIVEAENTETHKIETRESSLTETESGKFSGTMPVMHPLHGKATVKIKVTGCEHVGEEIVVEFPCYIDPSGKVVDGNHENVPLWEATVTLLRSTTELGTYTAVENGSAVMSPANRVNPDKSRENGAFGWDTIEGWYKVEATKAGCGTASTAAFHVPPPQESLEIVLHCEGEQWKLGSETGEIAQLAITAPAKCGEGNVRVENVSFGAASIKVLKETGIECTLKKACEGKTLSKGEKCETGLEKGGSKPEYELEVEWKGKKFTKKFSA